MIGAGRCLTNATLGEALRRHSLLKQSNAWQHTRTLADKKGRSSEFQRLSKEAGFTLAALTPFARTCKNEAGWKDRLGSNVVQRIAEQVFAAVQQHPFGKRGRPLFKGINRPLHSLEATTNAANIIWNKETGCIVLGDLTLPALLPSAAQDPTVHQALASKTKYCLVLWRNVNGERRWSGHWPEYDCRRRRRFGFAGEVLRHCHSAVERNAPLATGDGSV